MKDTNYQIAMLNVPVNEGNTDVSQQSHISLMCLLNILYKSYELSSLGMLLLTKITMYLFK